MMHLVDLSKVSSSLRILSVLIFTLFIIVPTSYFPFYPRWSVCIKHCHCCHSHRFVKQSKYFIKVSKMALRLTKLETANGSLWSNYSYQWLLKYRQCGEHSSNSKIIISSIIGVILVAIFQPHTKLSITQLHWFNSIWWASDYLCSNACRTQ